MHYFDQTASTLPYEAVLARYSELSRTVFANPSAIHRLGYQAEQVIQQALKELADLLGCQAREWIVTSGATESINLAVLGSMRAHPNLGRNIVTWACEHKATLEACEQLKREGYTVSLLRTTAEGGPDLEQLQELLRDKPALVTLSAVNNETGVVIDWKRIVQMRKTLSPRTLLHVDAVQAWNKLPFRLGGLAVDLASFSGHKIHAPKGIGLLYVRKGLILQPLQFGGGQQGGVRSGTENPVLLGCLAEAARIGASRLSESLTHVRSLNRKLRAGISALPFVTAINSPESASPYILNVSFPGVRPETLVHALAGEGIYVATHAACSGGASRSHVLDEMQILEEAKTSALRISLDPDHTEEEVDGLLEALARWVPTLYSAPDLTRGRVPETSPGFTIREEER